MYLPMDDVWEGWDEVGMRHVVRDKKAAIASFTR